MQRCGVALVVGLLVFFGCMTLLCAFGVFDVDVSVFVGAMGLIGAAVAVGLFANSVKALSLG